MPSLFLVVGERSGDRHGAGLIESLRARTDEEWIFSGLGGPQMKTLAPSVDDWVEEAGVVGLVEVLRKYGWFRQKFAATLQRILSEQPNAVVLIDYPGFNLRLAKALRKAKFPGKIIYYISPQVWAWHRGRIPEMAKMLDLMLCIFPFEKALYEGFGLKTEFAGHPLVAWHRKQDRGLVREENLIGLFPGSRKREITKLFPVLLEAGKLLAAKFPNSRFVASAASSKLAAIMEEMAAANPLPNLKIETGNVYDLMRQCTVGAVASGTATLEAAILGLPHCLIYKVAAPTYYIGKQLIKVPYLGIVNILAGRELVKELIQQACTGQTISSELTRLMESATTRDQLTQELNQILHQLGDGDAYARAAQLVSECLSRVAQ